MQPEHADRPALRPPQFRLRTMLLLTAYCGALLALTQIISPLAVVGIAFFSLTIAAHVAGNAIGSRLRDQVSNPQPTAPFTEQISRTALPTERFAPATHLSKRRPLGWPLFAATVTGVVIGAAAGGMWPLIFAPKQATSLSVVIENVAVGMAAFGTLGGIGAFLAAGFLQVAIGAFAQAWRAGPKH